MKCDYEHCQSQMTVPLLTITVGDTGAGAYWGNYCSYACAKSEMVQTWDHLADGKSLSSVIIKNAVAETVENTNVVQLAQPQETENLNVDIQATFGDTANPFHVQPMDSEPMDSESEDVPGLPEAQGALVEDHMAWDTGAAPSTWNVDTEKCVSDATKYAGKLTTMLCQSLSCEGKQESAQLHILGHYYGTKIFTLNALHKNLGYVVQVAPYVHDDNKVDVVINFTFDDQYNVEIDLNEALITDEIVQSLASHIKSAGALIVESAEQKSENTESVVEDNF